MNYHWQKDSLAILDDEQKIIAEIGFKMINDEQTYVVERTWVDPNTRGQGLAGKITVYFLKEVKKQAKTVLPLCPYTQAFFEKHAEYTTLLFKQP
ncbi:GNAT family N-acetyltransferase [Ligilactobacillus sp. Marseille-Q7487]|uniref:GNAT family N-acetyltransferase n=1 Tax=Ligilactobacillus sp. Marseille-Q7487 TaxID=3022128 RepID=UPI0024A98A95|nr:GNAT family N-acetyltransferase [Ligilactobacillus sp. Marseille-Q7487]